MADDPASAIPPLEGAGAAEAHEKAVRRLSDFFVGRSLPRIRAIVEDRLQKDPHFLLRHDRAGRIPLHRAAAALETGVLEYLVRRCPESVRVRTRDGQENLALHLYVMHQSHAISVEGARLLTDAWPASVLEPSADGSLPLHHLARAVPHLRQLDVFRVLSRQGPMALRTKNGSGQLPIHCLLSREANNNIRLERLRILAEWYPPSLLGRDNDGYLPIHLVAKSRFMDLPVFRYLVTTCPESAREMMPDGTSLLHAGVSNRWRIEAVRPVLDASPDSLQRKDAQGDLPLHTAARLGDLDLVQALTGPRPDLARSRGKEGALPLHVAAEHQSVDIVQHFVGLWPEAVYELDDAGRTPLHLAVRDPIRFALTVSKVQYLVNFAPELLWAVDDKGRLPLHSALDQESMLTYPEKSEVSLAVVRCLLEIRPEALRLGDVDGNLPLHIAASRYVPIPVLSLLIKRCPEALRLRNHHGMLPVHLAMHRDRSETLTQQFERCKAVRECYLNHEVESVHFLVEPWPESLLERHPKGGTLLHRAFDGPATPGSSVVLPLLQIWPGTSLAEDDQGLLPVHAAAAADAPLDMLFSILLAQDGVLGGRTRHQSGSPTATTETTDPPSRK